jgi:hypothetical protein
MSEFGERKPNVAAGNRNQRINHEFPGHVAEPNAMPRMEESSIIVFCALFHNDWRMGVIPLYEHTEAYLPDNHPTGQTGLVPSPIGR